MAKGPSFALQKAVFAALRASSDLSPLIGGDKPRIYDRVPPDTRFPYVTIGDDDIADDSNACFSAWEATVTVHVFSRGNDDRVLGKTEAKQIGDAVQSALEAALVIDGFATTEFQFQSARYFTEPDGLTAHGVIVHRYLIDAA